MNYNEQKHSWLQKKAELVRLKSDEAQALLELFEQNEVWKEDLADPNARQSIKQSAEKVLYDLAPRIKQLEKEVAVLTQQL